MASEHQLLMKGPLVVKTILGLKTETRRIIRPEWSRCLDLDDIGDAAQAIRGNPYGHPGDTLWVRENWKHEFIRDSGDGVAVGVVYQADGSGINTDLKEGREQEFGRKGIKHGPKWRPSIHMPRHYCRLLLTNKGVSIERIQEIGCADIRAEGFSCPQHDFASGFCTSECPALRQEFATSWDEINGGRGFTWELNSHVFVVKYEVAECLVHT